jgi:lipocalin
MKGQIILRNIKDLRMSEKLSVFLEVFACDHLKNNKKLKTKTMKFLILSIVLAICTIESSAAAAGKVGFEGKCPVVPFVDNFNAQNFIGKWYGIKQSGAKEIPCITFQIDQPRPDYFESFMSPLNATLQLEKANADSYAEGFTVSFKANPFMDGGNLRLFATDYGELRVKFKCCHSNFIFISETTENYAASLICKQGEKNYYLSLFVWSRTQTLSEEATGIINGFFTKYSLDVTDLADVKQTECAAAKATV